MNKVRQRGEKFRPVVTVLKVKNGVPTVIRVSGREYVFRPKDQYGNRKKGGESEGKTMSREEILQERLDRVSAIVDVIEEHGDLDATTLTQLRQALSWVPDDLPDETRVYGNDRPGGRCEF